MTAAMVKTSTPGIYKRGSRYVVAFRVDGKQKWETAATLADARSLRARRITQADAGELTGDSRLTLQDYGEEWLVNYHGRGRGFRESTRRVYKGNLERYVFPALGHVPLTKITTRKINAFVADLTKTELKDATIGGILNPLRACLATAVDEDLIRYNPTRGIHLPRREANSAEGRRVPRPYSEEQLMLILDTAPAKFRDLLELLAGTGLRIGEALALQWKHLELSGGEPHVHVTQSINELGEIRAPKTRASQRRVPLAFPLADRFARRRSAAGAEADDWVFPTRKGTPYRRSNVRQKVRPVLEEAGATWTGAGFHTFRHTYASMLFDAGVNVKQVSRLLGHHAASLTLDTYVHLMRDDLGAGLDVRRSANRVQTQHPEIAVTRLTPDHAETAWESDTHATAGTLGNP